MEINSKNYCVILAGGRGRRLWPCSRDQYPKQFIDFFGTGRTQLQTTYDRFVRLLPKENIYICTCKEYVTIVKEQLPDFDEHKILVEPLNRNTAPSVAWANMRIKRIDPDANIIITPSEPGYGYIQLGDLSCKPEVFRVKSFTEKPEREFAKMFMESGEFYWNTSVFISNTRYLTQSFEEIFPSVLRNLKFENPNYTYEEELEYVAQNYPRYPNLSIDYAILEHSQNVYVMKCDFGWADLGTWHAIYECMSKGEDDNVIVNSNVMLEDSHNNVIKLPKDRLGVINGLDGYIVAEEGNVLLICKKGDSSAMVRKYVNEVQMKYGDDFV